MAQRNRFASNQDFLHQQPQDLLSHGDIEHLGSNPQFGAKPRQGLGELEVFGFIHGCHLQRL
jgi:hypothetical protein